MAGARTVSTAGTRPRNSFEFSVLSVQPRKQFSGLSPDKETRPSLESSDFENTLSPSLKPFLAED